MSNLEHVLLIFIKLKEYQIKQKAKCNLRAVCTEHPIFKSFIFKYNQTNNKKSTKNILS